MTKPEIEQVIATIQRRGDPAYNTPSGAFLEHISTLAVQLNVAALAEACEVYVAAHPESAAFIAARVPGILCNRYFTVLPGFDYEKFIQWSVNTPDWASEIKTGFSSVNELSAAVASIKRKIEKHV